MGGKTRPSATTGQGFTDFRSYLNKELKGTALVRLPLNEFSVKIRTGDPIDDEADINLPHWAGVIPIEPVYGTPVGSANLPEGIQVSDTLLADVKP